MLFGDSMWSAGLQWSVIGRVLFLSGELVVGGETHRHPREHRMQLLKAALAFTPPLRKKILMRSEEQIGAFGVRSHNLQTVYERKANI